MLKLAEVRVGARAEVTLLPQPPPDPDFTLTFRDAVSDSRQARSASLFFALRGERSDGHDFALEAVLRGATGIVGRLPVEDMRERLHSALRRQLQSPIAYLRVADPGLSLQQLGRYWRQRHKARVVGITGSLGKTTAKEVTAQVIGTRWRTLKNEGNMNSEVGLPLSLLRLNRRHEVAVLEMGMYELGDIGLLAEIAQPQLGVITAIGPAHLERIGSMERIVVGKAELLEKLPASGFAIVNGDDRYWRDLARKARAQVVTYGLGEAADVRGARLCSRGPEGISFELSYAGHSATVGCGVWGRQSIYAALAAAAVGLLLGMSFAQVVEALGQVRYSRMAIHPVGNVADALVLDDRYNALPASVEAALQFLTELGGSRRVAVLGDMLELGEASEEGHRVVGRLASTVADSLLTVGKRAREIAAEARRRGMAEDAVGCVDSNDEALGWLQLHLQRGDRVLIKGSRGMYMEQIVAGLTRP